MDLKMSHGRDQNYSITILAKSVESDPIYIYRLIHSCIVPLEHTYVSND